MSKDDKIREVIMLFARASGRKNILPRDTNPRDTYQWRYVSKFVDTMAEASISWDTVKKIVCFIVEHIREHKSLWTKGLWALTRKDIIDISYQRMAEYERGLDHEIDLIRRSHQFVISQAQPLSFRRNGDAYPNIVIWHNTNRISMPYMAVSKSCNRVISTLPEDERALLPMNNIQIWRILLSTDKQKRDKVRQILPHDILCYGENHVAADKGPVR